MATSGTLQLSLEQAIARGLQYNLGLIDDQEANADARAQREHALAALLPQISARAEQTYQQLSFKSINVTLPPQTGLKLPPTSGQFGYSEARFTASSPLVNISLLDGYRQQKGLEDASALETKDARDVVVFVVGAAYFQVVASEAQLRTAHSTARWPTNTDLKSRLKSTRFAPTSNFTPRNSVLPMPLINLKKTN